MRRAFVCAVLVLGFATFLSAVERDHDIVPEDYFDLANVGNVSMSPNGAYCAYTESRWGEGSEGRKTDLWVVNIKTGAPLRLTFDGFGGRSPVWSPDSAWIYFKGSDPHAKADAPPYDGTSQVWRIAPTGGTPFAVTRVADGLVHFALTSDGGKLIYTTAEEVFDEEFKNLKKEFSDLEYGHGVTKKHQIFSLDLISWRTKQIREAVDVIHEIALAPTGEKLAMITTSDNELIYMEGWSRVDVFDIKTGGVEVVTSDGWREDHPSPFGWLGNLAWSKDSGALAFTVGFDGFQTEIYVAELSDSVQLSKLERPDELSVSGSLTWRGHDRTLCYLGEKNARVRIIAHNNVRDGKSARSTVLTPGDFVIGGFSFDSSGLTTIASIDTTEKVGELYVVGSDGKLSRISNINPQVDSWKLPQIEHITWIGADGDSVSGILELPPGYDKKDGPLPLIVELHGGPTSSTKYRLRLWIYGRALMPSKGYALLSPNYHGSTGYGDKFMTKLIGRENEIEVADINRGIDHLIKDGLVDEDRIGVMGWSNGGFLTNSMIAASPERFKAASSGAGVVDMVIQWGVEDTPGHVINYMKGQLPWDAADEYIKASPLYGLADAQTPTLIHVGGSDPRVPAAHSRALYRALRHYLHVPVELVVYPGEGHGLSTHENRLAKMKWDLAWFEKYLGTSPEAE